MSFRETIGVEASPGMRKFRQTIFCTILTFLWNAMFLSANLTLSSLDGDKTPLDPIIQLYGSLAIGGGLLMFVTSNTATHATKNGKEKTNGTEPPKV